MNIENLLYENETIIESDKNEKKNLISYLKKFEKFYSLVNIQKVEEEFYKGMFSGTEYKYHYIVELCNGCGKTKSDWSEYLYNLFYIFDKSNFSKYNIKNAWIIRLVNDEYHNEHHVFIGFDMN